MSKKEKIAALLLLFIVVTGIITLAFYSNRGKQPLVPATLSISGNRLLSSEEYLAFTGLTPNLKGKGVTLSGIKKVFEKHPYIRQADVNLHPNGEVTVLLTERPVAAVLVTGNDKFLLDYDFRLIPILRNTRDVDYPVITNCPGFINAKTKVLKTPDIETAFSSMEALRQVSAPLAGHLAEINLRNGGDIVLVFDAFPALVLLGKYDIEKKVAALAQCYAQSPALFENGIYIDIRFTGRIFIREAEKGNV